MATYSTTAYAPAPDGHLFAPAPGQSSPAECAVCGEGEWRREHALAETFIPEIEITGPGWFAGWFSTTRGADWGTNGLRWRDLADAERWCRDLTMRWFALTDVRIRACDRDGEPVGEPVRVILSSD